MNDSQLIWEAYRPGPDEGLDTSWADGKDVLTLRKVLSYLDKTSVPVKDVDVNKLKSIIIPPKDPERTKAATLDHPIIVIINLEGKYQSILDGNHRLQQAIDTDKQIMKVRELDLRTAPDLYKRLLNYKIKRWMDVPYRSHSDGGPHQR